ncbi:IS3 family transposase [Collinsella stercoris]|uniref:IS3 family transposase n=1 Tax=Collinsella stercoris TaxID=147206 RepID=UPI003992EBC1
MNLRLALTACGVSLKTSFSMRHHLCEVMASMLPAFEAGLEGYIHHWNHVRRQVKLKGLTPVEFREQALREAA